MTMEAPVGERIAGFLESFAHPDFRPWPKPKSGWFWAPIVATLFFCTALFLAIVLPTLGFARQGFEGFGDFITVLFLLWWACAILVGLFGLLDPKFRSVSCWLILWVVISFVAVAISGNAGVVVRSQAFRSLADRSAPLVKAIKAYCVDHGGPPGDLNELLPVHLSAIPKTGMGSYPEYQLQNLVEKPENGNDWKLVVYCPAGMFNWDSFVYYPSEDYTKVTGDYLSVQPEPMGDWCYLHSMD